MRLFTLILLLFTNFAFCQSNEGFWDNIRTTNETFAVKSGEKKLIKSADFPIGTTEVVFRITVLDDNQKISGSLVSVLKAIPDPTGISQGAAGGVFLLSTISGEDKCRYAVFKSATDAENYIKTEKAVKACFAQETPINKEVKLLSSDSKCLESNPKNLYFVFDSDNWILKEKIVLEIVPWVNNKLSRGWNDAAKGEIMLLVAHTDWIKQLTKRDQFFAVYLEYIQNKYTYTEFRQLLKVEKSKLVENALEEGLKKSGEIDKYYNAIRDRSLGLFLNGKTDEAIDLIKVEMFAKNRADYRDYGVLGDYYLLTGQFSKAEGYYNEGLRLNPTEVLFRLNLAHVYLFTDRLPEAKQIHKKYYRENLSRGKSWVEQTKKDFSEFKKRGMDSRNFEKIMRIIQ